MRITQTIEQKRLDIINQFEKLMLEKERENNMISRQIKEGESNIGFKARLESANGPIRLKPKTERQFFDLFFRQQEEPGVA